ncbi:MAG TPA: hypothetical protein VNH20_05555 [Candidatus Dormibacteraeota bacterium]|nr:hypothetical protein [Candidatus Dormibacteraeota bacterium]
MTAEGPLGVASAAGEEQVELYVRTYRSLLRSSGEIRLQALERAHLGMESSLHPLGAAPELDSGALLYSLHRLPPVVLELEHVYLGQSPELLRRQQGSAPADWLPVVAPGRRRRWWWNPELRTLAVALASSSDLDDLVPTLVAMQLEWNKAHALLHDRIEGGAESLDASVRGRLGISEDDWIRLSSVFGPRLPDFVAEIIRRPMDLGIRLLGGSQVGYARATREWWRPLGDVLRQEKLIDRPLYFVSSNAHCLVNLLSGVARERAGQVEDWVAEAGDPELRAIADELSNTGSRLSRENFLYYAARRWFGAHPEELQRRAQEERGEGIFHIPSQSGTDVAAQLIVLDRLQSARLDPRLRSATAAKALSGSPHLVLNIQYPLGQGAYHILRQVMEATDRLDGVYILGKAATLNADVGDVLVSDVVHDEQSGNTYWLNNCFSFATLSPFVTSRSVLDRQRAVSVRSTFLQNRGYLERYYRDAYTVVEMEAGPYLGAVFEAGDSSRYPDREQVDLTRPAMEVGVIHYASDTPYTQARTLGARGLHFEGMEATYAGALAIAARILEREGGAALTPGMIG